MQKVKVIPNGVNEIFFNPDLDGMIIKNKYGLKDDCKVVLFVGRLDYYKGCDYLIRAFSKVLWSVSNSHLIMVGGGPLKEKLKEIASCLKISENISFAGHVKDELLPYYYAACDVFVLPSISSYEGFGMVQLEAMACAKPVITTTLPGVSEIDADEVATLHVPPKDEDLLARSLIKILQNDELAINLGRNGRKLIIDKYSWSKVIVALEELYFKLTVGRVNANLSIRRMQR